MFTYSYDSYKRLTQIMVGSTVLRSFMYDTNTLEPELLRNYTQGRLVAVQNQPFTPQGYQAGQGGSNVTVPATSIHRDVRLRAIRPESGKRLQAQETFKWYVNNVLQNQRKPSTWTRITRTILEEKARSRR